MSIVKPMLKLIQIGVQTHPQSHVKRRSIAALALFLGGAAIIAQTELRATEGSNVDRAGMSSSDPDRWRSLASTGVAALESERYDVAIRFLSAAIDVGVKNEDAAYLYSNRGDAYLGKGDSAKALADYARAVNFVPKTSEDHLIRGDIYKKMGNYKAAASDFARGMVLSPDDVELANALAWAVSYLPGSFVARWARGYSRWHKGM